MDSILLSNYFWFSIIFGTSFLLYFISKTFNFYCKLLLYYVLILGISLLSIPHSLLRPGNVKNTVLTAYIFKFSCRIFGIKWEIRGKEHLMGKEPCVVLCNHQSSVDVIGMMELWPILSRCVPMIKKELKYFSGPFGVLATLAGSVFIDRFNPDKARDTVNGTVKYLKEKNTKLWVFPEGTRNANGTFLPFKKGAFHIAVQGKMPILPIVFSSYSKLYNKKKHLFEPGVVTITVLPPIPTDDLKPSDVSKFTERVRLQMLETFCKVSNLPFPEKSENGTK